MHQDLGYTELRTRLAEIVHKGNVQKRNIETAVDGVAKEQYEDLCIHQYASAQTTWNLTYQELHPWLIPSPRRPLSRTVHMPRFTQDVPFVHLEVQICLRHHDAVQRDVEDDADEDGPISEDI